MFLRPKSLFETICSERPSSYEKIAAQVLERAKSKPSLQTELLNITGVEVDVAVKHALLHTLQNHDLPSAVRDFRIVLLRVLTAQKFEVVATNFAATALREAIVHGVRNMERIEQECRVLFENGNAKANAEGVLRTEKAWPSVQASSGMAGKATASMVTWCKTVEPPSVTRMLVQGDRTVYLEQKVLNVVPILGHAVSCGWTR